MTQRGDALEGLAMDGGLQIVLAAVELLMIPFVLSWGVSTRLEILLLLSWLCLTAILVAENMRERFRWTNARLGLTHRLVENMTAHRPRVMAWGLQNLHSWVRIQPRRL